jgi:hypothetical protein
VARPPELRVQLTKRPDGGAVLRCVRADGSATWQRQEGRQAAFFPLHDLEHYAVETELGFRGGFFGLVADGWAVEDTGGKGARGPLPPEAILVEHLVGFLDVERATGGEWSAAEFAEQLASAGVTMPPAGVLTDDALGRVRARRLELFSRWTTTYPGETLELPFDRDARSA